MNYFTDNQFRNKVVLITGASRGIGNAILTKFAENNAIVIGTATTDTSAQKISEQLSQHDVQGCGIKLDITSVNECDTMMKYISETYGNPSILINNAGITNDNLLLKMSTEQWYSVINTNLNGIYYLTQLAIKSMIKARWGRIINISSVVASTGNPGQTNYCAAKAGLEGFTRALALEVASRNITVNAVAPGFIATDMTKKLPEKAQENLINQIPLKRIGQAEEIAFPTMFLASEQASYLTGIVLPVNGGMYTG